MQRIAKLFLAFILTSFCCSTALACLWDHDTLAMERMRFPGALELITGKFLRHSPEFYQWRVKDRERRLPTESTPELYDDLAVAYEKLGDHTKAIVLMEQKEQLFPGLYKTRANLGTFYILAGQLEQGVAEVEKALVIEPDAHFGREIYQKHLVNYMISRRKDGEIKLPLDSSKHSFINIRGFAKYLTETQQLEKHSREEAKEMKRALVGVQGMMRFANYDSPVLLEALGDLLLYRGEQDAKQLAARAYLKASYEVKDPDAQAAYRKLAEESLDMQLAKPSSSEEMTLDQLEAALAAELAEAKAWFVDVKADENGWIRGGMDADREFFQKYHQEPQHSPSHSFWPWKWVVPEVLFLLLCGAAWVFLSRHRARRTLLAASAQ